MAPSPTAQPAATLDDAPPAARAPGAVGRFLLSPPGWPLITATASVAAATLCAASGPRSLESASATVLAVFGWAGVAVLWIGRRAGLNDARRRFGRRSQTSRPVGRLRWLVPPAVTIVTVIACLADVPATVRFRLSRPALERAGRAALARRRQVWPIPGRVGLYDRCTVEAYHGAAYFTLPETGTDDSDGFAYSPAGPPTGWHPCEPLGGPWYQWHESPEPRSGGP